MKKLAAIIIEDRFFFDFGKKCKDHLKHLPKDTDLLVYVPKKLQEEYSKQLEDVKFYFREYETRVQIPHYIRYNSIVQQVIKDEKLNAVLNMCLFVTSPSFWIDLMDYERVLIFQMDSGILRSGIEEFYEWDYVGAPCYNFYMGQTVQNGGLSLRNPKIMEYICRMYGWNCDIDDLMAVGYYSTASFFAEDVFFCCKMIKHSIGKLASIEASKRFSCEVKYELGTFGYHRIEPYMTKEEAYNVMNQYRI